MQISLEPLFLSLKVGFVCLGLHLVLGVLLGYYLSRANGLVATICDICVTLPLVFPPIALGYFLLVLFGKYGMLGFLDLLFSFEAVVLASFIAGLPLVVKPIESAFSEQTKTLELVSFTLGRGWLDTFIFISLPCIIKTLITALFLGFARSIGEVGITLLIGGNIIGKTETISLAIYNASLSAEYEIAGFYAMILGGVALAIFLILRVLQKPNL